MLATNCIILLTLGHSNGGLLGQDEKASSRDQTLLMACCLSPDNKEVLWHPAGAHTIPGRNGGGRKGNRYNTIPVEGFVSRPFLTASHLQRDRSSSSPGGWSAAHRYGNSTERLRIGMGMLTGSQQFSPGAHCTHSLPQP